MSKVQKISTKQFDKGTQSLVKLDENYYVISTNKELDETLAFPANEKGDIVDWREVAGGDSYESAAQDLERKFGGAGPSVEKSKLKITRFLSSLTDEEFEMLREMFE